MSISMLEMEMRILTFSRNNANGILVVNDLLEMASAVVLSERVGMRMGMREPGQN